MSAIIDKLFKAREQELIAEFRDRFQIACPRCEDFEDIKIKMTGDGDYIWLMCYKCGLKFKWVFSVKEKWEDEKD